MKFTFSIIFAATFAASVSAMGPPPTVLTLGINETCYVKFNETEYKYDDVDTDVNGIYVGFCGKHQGKDLDCNFDIADDGETPDIIEGKCELTACYGSNKGGGPPEDTERVTICHRTCSEKNPWVRITIDKDAWNNETSECLHHKHGPHHNVEDDCKGVTDFTSWGDEIEDHLLYDHGSKADVRTKYGFAKNSDEEKAYWNAWQPGCPAVRGDGKCCGVFADKSWCCGGSAPPTMAPAPTTTTTTIAPPPLTTTTAPPNSGGGAGGDPHFARWGQSKESFHGECDLVMIHSDSFQNGLGFDLHVRTTIDSFYSVSRSVPGSMYTFCVDRLLTVDCFLMFLLQYIEAGALRVGDVTLEMEKEAFYLNGVKKSYGELPLSVGGFSLYNSVNKEYKQVYVVDLNGFDVQFSFYKNLLSITTHGHGDLSGAVGILGKYPTGKMVSRSGAEMSAFVDFAFEWQVHPTDAKLFHEDRSPQLPYERCRMPTEGRPSRRKLRANGALYEQAMTACAATKTDDIDIELCVGDVLATGDVGVADAW